MTVFPFRSYPPYNVNYQLMKDLLRIKYLARELQQSNDTTRTKQAQQDCMINAFSHRHTLLGININVVVKFY